MLACIKHFVCNDQEDQRKAVDTIVTERALREIYLKPFQIALRDSNPKSLMTAYNKVNGVHVSQSKYLLQDILRKEWGFNGLTMSDWHGTYSIKESLDAGLNLEMPGPTRFRLETPTSHKVYCNEIHIDVLNENVRYFLDFVNNCIKVGIPLGAIEEPNTSPEASALLRKIGGESIVLLKNEGNILPLSKKAVPGQESIAVIGPNAKTPQESGGGSAALSASYIITPYEGISQKLKEGGNSVTLEYSLGATLDTSLPDVGLLLTNSEGKPGITANFYKLPPTAKGDRQKFETRHLKSSRNCMTDFTHHELGEGFLYYVDFIGDYVAETTGTFTMGCSTLGTVQIFVNEKLIVDNKTNQTKGDAFFLGHGTREETNTIEFVKGETYNIRVEFGSGPTYTLGNASENGGVYFGFSVKTTPEIEIKKAIEVAKSVDRVILCAGLSKQWESEGFDRPNMDIPGYTNQLIEAVAGANPNIIVVNQSGSPVSMPWIDKVPALIHAWYGGNELGNTISDVLFGDINPSGKLSLTFPRNINDNPSFLNFGSTNGRVLYGEDVFVGYRFYEKVKKDVLFPFGFGLSYSSFELSNLEINVTDGKIVSTVKVSNTGKFTGSETVQLYIQQQSPSIIRPIKELKEFSKVYLNPGESKVVKLSVSIKEATSFWDSYRCKWASESGKYNVLVGNSSDNVPLTAEFNLPKSEYWLGLK